MLDYQPHLGKDPPQQASSILDVLYSASSAAKYDGRSLLQKYDVRPVPGKGLGVVATTNFSRGDHILSDPPIIIVDHCAMAHVPQYHLARLFNGAAARLSPVQKDRMTGLAVFGDGAPDEWYLVGRIYATNAYMIDMDVGVTGCGVGALFPEAYHFNPTTATMDIHAVRPILAGEDITVSYISPFLTRANRQSLLHDRWGFQCTCAACSAPEPSTTAPYDRLEKVASLWPLLLDEREFGVPTTDEEMTNATELADLLVSLAREETGLDAVLLHPYRVAALEWNAAGDREKAVEYAKLAVSYGTRSFGPWDRGVEDMRELVEDPEGHWSWRLRTS
ncbi:SET domain-containing protein 5 [Diaporthe eres]